MAARAHRVRLVRQCTGCGAVIEFCDAALSTSCSYCDGPTVDEHAAAAAIDAIVPFRVPERGALDQLRLHLARSVWASDELRRLRVHGRGLRAVLVPCWVYEGVVRSRYRAQIGLVWTETRTHENAKGERVTREVAHTEWLPLRGTAGRQIEDRIVSASLGLEQGEVEALAPFDLGWAQPHDPRLMSGLEAELPTLSRSLADETVARRLREVEGDRIRRELLPGERTRLQWIASEVEVHDRRMVLLPVWVATFRHGRQVLRLLVNGQTGQVTGRVPISRLKLGLALAAAALVGIALWWLASRSGGVGP